MFDDGDEHENAAGKAISIEIEARYGYGTFTQSVYILFIGKFVFFRIYEELPRFEWNFMRCKLTK